MRGLVVIAGLMVLLFVGIVVVLVCGGTVFAPCGCGFGVWVGLDGGLVGFGLGWGAFLVLRGGFAVFVLFG